MRQDDRQRREVDRDVVDGHRVAVLEAHAAAAGHARADAAVARVEEDRQAGFGKDLVERVRDPVVGEELLQRRVQLEPADDPGIDEPPRLAHSTDVFLNQRHTRKMTYC